MGSDGGGSHEFSGVIDLSGMLAKKDYERKLKGKKGKKKAVEEDESEFVIKAHDGSAKRAAELEVSINDKLIALGLQAHNYKAGVVSAFKADRGGQVMVYQ